jgi:hypothetical protein
MDDGIIYSEAKRNQPSVAAGPLDYIPDYWAFVDRGTRARQNKSKARRQRQGKGAREAR